MQRTNYTREIHITPDHSHFQARDISIKYYQAPPFFALRSRLIDVRDQAIRHLLLVGSPVLSIPTHRQPNPSVKWRGRRRNCDVLLFALLFVPQLPMDQEHGEVGHVEVCDGRLEASRERPREGHEEVATASTCERCCVNRYRKRNTYT